MCWKAKGILDPVPYEDQPDVVHYLLFFLQQVLLLIYCTTTNHTIITIPFKYTLGECSTCIVGERVQAIHSQLLRYPWFNKCARSGCIFWLSFISVIFQSHLGCQVVRKSYLRSAHGPAAIVLNYSVWNNVQQIKVIIDSILDSTH